MAESGGFRAQTDLSLLNFVKRRGRYTGNVLANPARDRPVVHSYEFWRRT